MGSSVPGAASTTSPAAAMAPSFWISGPKKAALPSIILKPL